MKINLEEALINLETARQSNQDIHIANALFITGIAYLERNEFNKARNSLLEAHYICLNLKNNLACAQIYLRLADLDELINDLNNAEKKLKKALSIFLIENQDSGQVSTLERLSKILIKLNRQNEALIVLIKAIKLSTKNKDIITEIFLRQLAASLYLHLGCYLEGALAYHKLAKTIQTIGDSQRLALAIVGVGTCLTEAGLLKEGIEALNKAKKLFTYLRQHTKVKQINEEINRLSNQKNIKK